MGLTDSFGEWRKYLRLEESAQHKVRVEKMLGKKKYSAEKKFEIKFTEDKVAEVAVSLELKSRTFATTATQNKKRKTKLRKVVEVPQNLISISVRNSKKARRSLLAKHQSSVLADKVVPALISDLDKKGIKNVKKSKWQLVFSYVPKKGDVGYIKGDISWIDAKEKPIRQALSKNFREQSTTRREV